MTLPQFVLEFVEATQRPQVTVQTSALPRIRLWVQPTIAAPAVTCDPVGVVWWARTGTAHPTRLLDGLSYALSLGLSPGDALTLLEASDGDTDTYLRAALENVVAAKSPR